jgi:hypothetical protein
VIKDKYGTHAAGIPWMRGYKFYFLTLVKGFFVSVISLKCFRVNYDIDRTKMQKAEEVNINKNDIVVDRMKIVSLLTSLQMRKLTIEQAIELERLLTKERNRAIQNGITDLDIILGYYLIGLSGYVEGGYYPPSSASS